LSMVLVFVQCSCFGYFRQKVQQFLLKLDLFPVIPEELDRTSNRIKYFSVFGGVVGLTVVFVICGWIVISLINYKYYNYAILTALIPNISQDTLLSSVNVEVHSIGFSGDCVIPLTNRCSPNVRVLLGNEPLLPPPQCENTIGNTCKIIATFVLEDIASSVLAIRHPSNSSYNQGWGWQISVNSSIYDEISSDVPLVKFIPQSIGRIIEPDPINEVFSGETATMDVVSITPVEYISQKDSSKNCRSVLLSVVKNILHGSVANATTIFSSNEDGVYFQLSFNLDRYTKQSLEYKEQTIISLIVTIVSIFGIISIASSTKVGLEQANKKLGLSQRLKKLITKTKSASTDHHVDETHPLIIATIPIQKQTDVI